MNFPNVINSPCIPTTPPPPDNRCSDPVFALLHPDICANSPFLRIKPEILLTCALGSVQFEAFTVTNGSETLVTDGVTWSVSDTSVALIGVASGNATGIAPGAVTITATFNGLTATATLTVLAGLNCCNANDAATMLVVDKSLSMSLQFGAGYPTKQAFADGVASAYATQTNTQKDVIGLISFDESAGIESGLTSDATTVATDASGIVNTTLKTGIGLALQAAVTALAASTANTKVIVLISDGEDKDTNPANDPVAIATAFKNTGGVILCVGVRAHGAAFNLLNVISTGGFFVNCYPSIVEQALNWIYGLKGYLCAGNCAPAGNDYTNEPSLNYTGFANWTAVGKINLLGPGLLDPLPGNGLYVSMGFGAQLTSKLNFAFTAGKIYRLSFFVAGNQIQDFGTQQLTCQIGDGTQFKQVIIIPNFAQGLTKYSFNFSPVTTLNAPIIISSNAASTAVVDGIYCGPILNDVNLYDITDLALMFDDNFDGENLQFVPPACGVAAIYVPPSSVCADVDGSAFIAAANITDATQRGAICTLVTSLKAASLWTGMDAIYPFVGGNALSHSYNLRNPSKYQISWTGGVTHDASGITGDGTSGYGNTGFTPSTAAGNWTLNSASEGVYSRTATLVSVPPGEFYGLIGMGDDAGGGSAGLGGINLANFQVGIFGLNSTSTSFTPCANFHGTYVVSRHAAPNQDLYAPDGTSATQANASTTLPVFPFYILAHNEYDGMTTSPINLAAFNLAFAFMGSGLTAGQVATLKGIILAFQNTLGRA